MLISTFQTSRICRYYLLAIATNAMGIMCSSSDSLAPAPSALPDSMINWIATVVIKQQNIMIPIVSILVLPTGYLYTLGRAAIRLVMSMTNEETRSMKASAAVANNDSDPVEMAAYIWIMNRQKLTTNEALTANFTFGPFSMVSRAASRSSSPLWRNWSISWFCLV